MSRCKQWIELGGVCFTVGEEYVKMEYGKLKCGVEMELNS